MTQPAQTDKPKRASARLAQLDALQIALDGLRWETRANGADNRSDAYIEFLESVDAIADIEGIRDEIERIRDSFENYETTENRMARPMAPHEYVRCAR